MYKAIFVAIPKKSTATECEMDRKIALSSQVTKLVLKILLLRAKMKFKDRVSEQQNGFTVLRQKEQGTPYLF